MKFYKWILVLLLVISHKGSAKIESVKLSFPLKLSAPRWFYDESQKKGLTGVPLHLMRVRSFELDKKSESCLAEAAKLLEKGACYE